MSATDCKLCKSPSDFICSNRNEHGSVRLIHTFRCRSCGIAFVGNTITSTNLSEAYSREGINEYYAEIHQENHKKYITAALAVKRIISGDTEAAILDIGCGNGEFARLLADSGFIRLGVHEIPTADFQDLSRKGIEIHQDFDFGCIPSNSYDLITLLDVAEHVIDPAFLFRQCFRILRPGGHIYIHTPVVTVLDRCTQALCRVPLIGGFARVWQRGRVNIFHLQNFTRLALHQTLTAAHFEDISITLRNELSWPVRSYVRAHVCEKHRLPMWIATALAPILDPILKSSVFNRNKAIVEAKHP